jgi:hypothetical protein
VVGPVYYSCPSNEVAGLSTCGVDSYPTVAPTTAAPTSFGIYTIAFEGLQQVSNVTELEFNSDGTAAWDVFAYVVLQSSSDLLSSCEVTVRNVTTLYPSVAPTDAPTISPTEMPSRSGPSESPTREPVTRRRLQVEGPSFSPTPVFFSGPVIMPSARPSEAPSLLPTEPPLVVDYEIVCNVTVPSQIATFYETVCSDITEEVTSGEFQSALDLVNTTVEALSDVVVSEPPVFSAYAIIRFDAVPYPTASPTEVPTVVSPTAAPTHSPSDCVPGEYEYVIRQSDFTECVICGSYTYSDSYNAAQCDYCPFAEAPYSGATTCEPFARMHLPAFEEVQLLNVTGGIAVADDGSVFFTGFFEGSIGIYYTAQEFVGPFADIPSEYNITGLAVESFESIFLWDQKSCLVVHYNSSGVERIAGSFCSTEEANGVGDEAIFADNVFGQIAVGTDENVFVPGHTKIRKVRPVTGGNGTYEVHTLCYSPEVNPRGIAVDPSSGYVYFTTSDAIYYLSPTSHTPIQFVNGLQDSYGVPVSLTMDVSGYIFMSTTNVTALVAPTGYVTVLDDVPHNANIAVTADHLLYVSKDGTVTVVKGDDYCCDSMGG